MLYRDYQDNIDHEINIAWHSYRNVLAVLPTGAGKSVVVSRIIGNTDGGVCVIAHRQELVSQMSLHLARDGIYHNIVSSASVVKSIIKQHYAEYGKSFYNNTASVAVAGVDTIIKRKAQLSRWLPTVKLWVIDESHHVVGGDDEYVPFKLDDIKKDNKWGKAIKMFPNAKGLGVTATPLRLDGKGLGRYASGCFDKMIVGVEMRPLINQGYLTDYKIFAPVKASLDFSNVRTTGTGEFSTHDVADELVKSNLVVHDGAEVTGDVVQSYIDFANGELGITFVPNMDIGEIITKQFNDAGIPAELVNAKTPDQLRASCVKRLEKGELKQLVNVDIFGEGFDLPSISCVSMVRPTQSYGLFVQMFGRALRLMIDKNLHPNWHNYTIEQRLYAIRTSTKPWGIIIDHVGNVARHGLPDAKRIWTLDDVDKRGDQPMSTVKSCPKCSYTYERYIKVCPDCGYNPLLEIPVEVRTIEKVEGSLEELSPEFLAQLRGDVAAIDKPVEDQVIAYANGLNKYTNPIHAQRHIKNFHKKAEANIESQSELRAEMAQWAGYPRAEGFSNDEIFSKFYIKYGIDWLSAQALESKDADKLKEKINYEQ